MFVVLGIVLPTKEESVLVWFPAFAGKTGSMPFAAQNTRTDGMFVVLGIVFPTKEESFSIIVCCLLLMVSY